MLFSYNSRDIPSFLTREKFFSLDKDKFDKHVICPKCAALYQFNECLQTRPTGQISPKVCSHVAYRNHPHLSRREACGHRLLREIVTKSGEKIYQKIRRCYQKILPGVDVLEIPQLCRKYKSTLWYSQNLNTSKKQPVCILAKWIGEDGQIIDDSNPLKPCAGRVEYYFSQRVLVGEEHVEVNMAYVKWFQEHTARNT